MSMPPAMMTQVPPTAMMAYQLIGVATPPSRFDARKKLLTCCPAMVTDPPSVESNNPIRMITTMSPASCRRGMPPLEMGGRVEAAGCGGGEAGEVVASIG